MNRTQTLIVSGKPYLGLVSVVMAAASAPIAIRLAQEEGVPSLAIIALRLWMISLILAPFILSRSRENFQNLSTSDWGWVLLASLVHALTLAMLFFSLEYTSVLINSVLRRTSPVWVVGMEIMFLHAAFNRRVWLGVVLAVIGTTVVGLGGKEMLQAGQHPLLGGGLALLNALFSSVYLLIGRKIRDKIAYLPYSWVVFSGAAVVSSLMLMITNTSVTGYSVQGYFWVAVVTIISQFFGHIQINAVLHHFPATFLSVTMQLSVVVAAGLAVLFLGEIPSGLQMAGSVIIFSGVVLATREGGI